MPSSEEASESEKEGESEQQQGKRRKINTQFKTSAYNILYSSKGKGYPVNIQQDTCKKLCTISTNKNERARGERYI